ncbi:MAG: SDR family oxidoreductase, partial [Acetobacteraceae bacterium]|nr:SDR family oxidoreductase [Acetobacteraceae bacterium]
MSLPPHAIVSGASSGIGAAIARRLLDDGWAVTGISRSAPAEGIAHVPLDLAMADAEEVRTALADVPAMALVHAAGVLRVGGLGELDREVGREMWRLHVEAACLLAEAVLPRMPDGGRIVLVGSRTSTGSAGKSQYAATKAAVVGLARSWAAELIARGITVNVVAPGATETPMLQDPGRGSVPPKPPPIGRFIR